MIVTNGYVDAAAPSSESGNRMCLLKEIFSPECMMCFVLLTQSSGLFQSYFQFNVNFRHSSPQSKSDDACGFVDDPAVCHVRV